MWYWKVVFLYKSRNEKVEFTGTGYPSKWVAEWERSSWLKKFLPYFYLYQIVESEIGEHNEDLQSNCNGS
jgi:hypothetical protein